MTDERSGWMLPENLRTQEEREREAVDRGLLGGLGDFGSYYAFSRGIDSELIKSHAIADDLQARDYAENLRRCLARHRYLLGGDILDVGCAIGAITHALARLDPCGRASGLDISRYAVEFARRKYSDCRFYEGSADDLRDFADGSLDVIHAREFYPFTRTDDLTLQKRYLRLFSQKLKAGGLAVLVMRLYPEAFAGTFPKLRGILAEIGYSSAVELPVFPMRLARWSNRLPESAALYRAFGLVSGILTRLKPSARLRAYVFEK